MNGPARWLARGEAHLPAGLDWLSAAERADLRGRCFAKRRMEFLVSRWTAKTALAAALGLSTAEPDLCRVTIGHEPSGAPFPVLDGVRVPLPVSLSDRAGWAVCLLGSGSAGTDGGPVGCDLELVEPRSAAFVTDHLTGSERRAVAWAADPSVTANLIWSAKESALKVLGTGLRRDTRSVEVALPGAACATGWHPLTVTGMEGAVLPGWWRRYGDFLLTVAARHPADPPAALEEPPALAGAVAVHSWLRRPVVSGPGPGPARPHR